MKSRNPIVVETHRGAPVENMHQVMLVVTSEKGRVVAYSGNKDYLVYPRSSIKMLQAIPFVASGAIKKFSLDNRMIALACSSHRGQKEHLQILVEWLKKIDVQESILRCGKSYPADDKAADEMKRAGISATSIIHNCSGKHLGIISSCLALGENPIEYYQMNHPAQMRLRKVLSQLMKFNVDKVAHASDGCAIPTFAVPLVNVAYGLSELIDPLSKYKDSCKLILEALVKYPNLISGGEDYTTVINEKTKGRIIVKNGAEGSYAAVVPSKNIAIALKAVDGSKVAAQTAMSYVLRYFGALSHAEFEELKEYTQPRVLNSRGEVVGQSKVAGDRLF